MYKILYLPTAEDIVIGRNSEYDIIIKGISKYSICERHISAPRSLILTILEENGYDFSYKTAIFKSKKIAESHLQEMLQRPACKSFKMIRQQFEIIKIE